MPDLKKHDVSDDELIKSFENLELPLEHWTHLAHLRVAYVYLKKFSFEESLKRVRKNIKRFNAHHNVPETVDRGFHETITVTWLKILHNCIVKDNTDTDSITFFDNHRQLLDKKIPEKYYSSELLYSAQARKNNVEPDLHPLPLI